MIKKIDNLIEKLGESKNQSILLTFSIIIAFILIFILNIYFPLILDDWSYSFGVGGKRLENVSDIFHSQYEHYFAWGGRSVVHAIAQFLLLIPTWLHDLLNTIALLFLLYIFYKIANYKNSVNAFLFIVIALLMWFIQPGFASVYFWITGSANYMWGMLIIILFLYPYYSYYRNENSTRGNLIYAILFFVAGVITGWTNENMSFAVIAFVILFCWNLKKDDRKVPVWAILGIIGVVIGTVFMLKAPGNYIRLESEALDRGMDTSEGVITLEFILHQIPQMLFLYFKRLLYIIVPYCVLYYYFRKQKGEIEGYKKIVYSSLMFFIAAHIAFGVMVGSLLFPPRAYFGIICLLIIAFGILLANYNFKSLKAKEVLTLLGFVAGTAFSVNYCFTLNSFMDIDKTLASRAKIITEGKKEGQTDFLFYDGIKKKSSRLFYSDSSDDPNFWINRLYARYYGVNSVKVYSADQQPNNN